MIRDVNKKTFLLEILILQLLFDVVRIFPVSGHTRLFAVLAIDAIHIGGSLLALLKQSRNAFLLIFILYPR
jgi:hypothetical protein